MLHEAESASFEDAIVSTAIPGASGGAYVAFGAAPRVQTVTVWAGGTGGPSLAPGFDLLVNGQLLGSGEIADPQTRAERSVEGTAYAPFVFSFDGDVPILSVEIVYANDGIDPVSGENLNLWIDRVAFGGRTYESEIDGFYTPVRNLPSRAGPREDMLWDGTLAFAAPPPSTTQTIVVWAAGTGGPAAAPTFRVVADGAVVGTATIANPQTVTDWREGGADHLPYTFTYDAPEAAARVEIVYINDGVDPVSGENLNLVVDRVEFGAKSYESEVDGFYTPVRNLPGRAGPREDMLWGGTLAFERRPEATPIGSIAWMVEADAAGERLLRWRYGLADGQTTTMALSVNGAPAGIVTFDADGLAGGIWGLAETTAAFAEGVNTVRLKTIAGTGPNLDWLETIAPEPPPPGAGELTVLNPIGLPRPDRFVFLEHETLQLASPNTTDRQEVAVRLANTGDGPLAITGIALDGPFSLVDPGDAAAVIAPGAFRDVLVRFDADPVASGARRQTFLSQMRIDTDEDGGAAREATLYGAWFIEPERGNEVSPQQFFAAMGWTNAADGFTTTRSLLDNGGVVRLIRGEASVTVNGVETNAFYFQRADPSKPIVVTQLGSWQGQGDSARFDVFSYTYNAALGSVATRDAYTSQRLVDGFATDGRDSQNFFPRLLDAETIAGMQINSDAPLAFRAAGYWSDPARRSDNAHGVRMMEVYEDGARIENAFVLLQDFAGRGGNFDYNDNIYLLTNLKPFEGDAPV